MLRVLFSFSCTISLSSQEFKIRLTHSRGDVNMQSLFVVFNFLNTGSSSGLLTGCPWSMSGSNLVSRCVHLSKSEICFGNHGTGNDSNEWTQRRAQMRWPFFIFRPHYEMCSEVNLILVGQKREEKQTFVIFLLLCENDNVMHTGAQFEILDDANQVVSQSIQSQEQLEVLPVIAVLPLLARLDVVQRHMVRLKRSQMSLICGLHERPNPTSCVNSRPPVWWCFYHDSC